MCGGVIFPYNREHRVMLAQLLPPDQVDAIEQSGVVRSVFWGRTEPVLPALLSGEEEDEEVSRIFLWGNRNKEISLPQTGWARIESMIGGKWDYLRPSQVVIPVTHGVEKGKWFEINHGIRGVLVSRDGHERVYMLTEEANPEFLNVTGHPRMPVLVEQDDFPWLPADPAGTLYAP